MPVLLSSLFGVNVAWWFALVLFVSLSFGGRLCGGLVVCVCVSLGFGWAGGVVLFVLVTLFNCS